MTVKESSQIKIEKICDLLKSQALEPASIEAKHLISEAQRGAKEIIHRAEKVTEKMEREALSKIAVEQKAAYVALQQAHKQALEALRQDIEKKIFTPALHAMLVATTNDPLPLANLINILAEAVEKEGLDTNFSVVVSAKVDISAVNNALIKSVLESLKAKSVEVGSLEGGILLKMHEQKITLDISEQAIRELLSKHLRKDFRDKIFGEVE